MESASVQNEHEFRHEYHELARRDVPEEEKYGRVMQWLSQPAPQRPLWQRIVIPGVGVVFCLIGVVGVIMPLIPGFPFLIPGIPMVCSASERLENASKRKLYGWGQRWHERRLRKRTQRNAAGIRARGSRAGAPAGQHAPMADHAADLEAARPCHSAAGACACLGCGGAAAATAAAASTAPAVELPAQSLQGKSSSSASQQTVGEAAGSMDARKLPNAPLLDHDWSLNAADAAAAMHPSSV